MMEELYSNIRMSEVLQGLRRGRSLGLGFGIELWVFGVIGPCLCKEAPVLVLEWMLEIGIPKRDSTSRTRPCAVSLTSMVSLYYDFLCNSQ